MPVESVNRFGYKNLIYEDVTWSTPGVDLVYARPVIPVSELGIKRLYGYIGIGGHIPGQPDQAYILEWRSIGSRGAVFSPGALVSAGFRSKWASVPIILLLDSVMLNYSIEYGYA